MTILQQKGYTRQNMDDKFIVLLGLIDTEVSSWLFVAAKSFILHKKECSARNKALQERCKGEYNHMDIYSFTSTYS